MDMWGKLLHIDLIGYYLLKCLIFIFTFFYFIFIIIIEGVGGLHGRLQTRVLYIDLVLIYRYYQPYSATNF